jgi:predicted DNA-binding protein YlxM (UPF0122 family)
LKIKARTINSIDDLKKVFGHTIPDCNRITVSDEYIKKRGWAIAEFSSGMQKAPIPEARGFICAQLQAIRRHRGCKKIRLLPYDERPFTDEWMQNNGFQTIPYYHFEKQRWYPSPGPWMAFYDYPNYRDPEIKRDISDLKGRQREWWAWQYGDNKIRIPGKPKKKKNIPLVDIEPCPKGYFYVEGHFPWFINPISARGCKKCPKPLYRKCKKLYSQAKSYINQDLEYEFTDFTDPNLSTCSNRTNKCKKGHCRNCAHYKMRRKLLERFKGEPDEKSAETAPEKTPNDSLDITFLYSTDIKETYYLFITGSFDSPEIAEVYQADFIDNFNKIKKTQSRTPSWAWVYHKNLWVLYMYFNMRLGIREIGRRVGLSHVRVLELVNQHRRVLEYHLDKVVRAGVSKSYFYEKYFNRLTVTQISEKYNVSHQNISKSIRRTKKKIKLSMQKTVASRQKIDRGILFSQNRKKIFDNVDTAKKNC